MNNGLDFLGLIACLIVGTTIFIADRQMKHTYKEQTESNQIESKQPKQQNSTKHSKVSRRDEVINTLDWMLANQIIDSREYSNLVVKSLPFLE